MNYFEQTKLGESHWWSWIVVTWLAFLGWLVFQIILMIPLPFIGLSTEPPLFDAFMSAAANVQRSDSAQSLSQLSLWLGIVATLAVLISLIATSPKARNNCAALAGIAIVFCFITSVIAGRGTDQSEVMSIVTQLMGASPVAFALFLMTFPVGLIALFLAQKHIHKRSLTSLHTAAKRFRWFRVIQGFFLTWFVLGAFAICAKALGFIDVQYVFNGKRFWIFALVSILFIPLQSATEEIVFRGYFNQGLTHFLKSKWIVFTITSFAFMALHLSNPEALEGAASGTLPIVMSGYFFFGFAMCLVVWIDDGLETAIGIHAGNNCFAAIIMNYENSVLPTPSIFLTGTDPVKDAVSTIVVLGILVAIIWFWRGGPKNHDPSASNDTRSIAGA